MLPNGGTARIYSRIRIVNWKLYEMSNFVFICLVFQEVNRVVCDENYMNVIERLRCVVGAREIKERENFFS